MICDICWKKTIRYVMVIWMIGICECVVMSYMIDRNTCICGNLQGWQRLMYIYVMVYIYDRDMDRCGNLHQWSRYVICYSKYMYYILKRCMWYVIMICQVIWIWEMHEHVWIPWTVYIDEDMRMYMYERNLWYVMRCMNMVWTAWLLITGR